MNTEAKKESRVIQSWFFAKSFLSQSNHPGQALVEFTLVFIILVVVAWIPADFGLGFYTAQLAPNAAREGARIASATSSITNGNCPMPACYSSTNNVLHVTANRLPAALLTHATVS